MASTPAPLPSLGLLDGLGEPSAPVDDRQGVIEHPLPMAWHADHGHSAAYAWYALGVLVANRDEVTPPPPPPPPATDSSGGAAYLPHIGLLLEVGAPPPAAPTVTLRILDKAEAGSGLPTSSGWDFFWYDSATTMAQAVAATPTVSLLSQSIGPDGAKVLTLTGSTKTSGQSGYLMFSNGVRSFAALVEVD